MKIKQSGKFNNITFEEGDILKVTVENEGTKNLYVGKFIYFMIKRSNNIFSPNEWGTIRKKLVFRHHTSCCEGVFEIFEDEIIDIKKLECKK
ncbi:MAG: hypothetical protein KKB88_05360 [Nanoarchaeota archaeon]|nr:hypothetical protein [Nanoarchaeota archaeon]